MARAGLEALLTALVFAFFARTFVVQAFQIPTASMEPSVIVGDHLLVNKWVYSSNPLVLLGQREVRRGDIVVFRSPEDPGRDFVKRCLGLPGDRVELIDKQLRINGALQDESAYVFHSDPRTYPRLPFLPDALRLRDNFGVFSVPPASYFCLGDNRENSDDSRFWGVVPASAIKGRALVVYWSGSPAAQESGSTGALGRIWRATRWERCLRWVR